MSNIFKIGSGRAFFRSGASVLALSLTLGLSGLAAPVGAWAETAVGEPLQSFADIVAANKPAVVTVTTEVVQPAREMQNGADDGMPPEEFFRRFFGENGPVPGFPMPGPHGGQPAPEQKGQALGSGFIVAADGTVVTNNHVIANATKITVTLDDGTELPATLVGGDVKNDIAVLKVEAKGPLPTVEWGNSDTLRMGDPILAIGDPFGVGTTVTSGIVSARGRDLNSGPFDDFIQIDAAINRGNSGGPLIDASGKVVGINTAIYSPNGGNVGLGFAIPSAQAQKVVEKILAKGTIEYGFIGVSIQPVDEQIAAAVGLKDAKGALVAAVQQGSPAADAGIVSGDVVLSVNGAGVDDPKALARSIADLAPGEKAALVVWRQGQEQTVEVTVGRQASETAAAQTAPEGAGLAVAELGLSVQTLTADDARQLGLPDGTEGALVTAVNADGTAAARGIETGDVIESVNQERVASAEDVARLIGDAKSGDRQAALLMIDRQGQKSFVAVPFAQS